MNLEEKWLKINKVDVSLFNEIIGLIDLKELFNQMVVFNPHYLYVEIWIEEDEIVFILRPQNEYAMNEDSLLGRILTTRNNNEWLYEGIAYWVDDDLFKIIGEDEMVTEEELIDQCIEEGDWEEWYCATKKELFNQMKTKKEFNKS